MSVYKPLFELAFQLTSNSEESYKIVMETIESAGKLVSNFKTGADLDSFLWVTIRNKSYDYLRYGRQ